MKKPKIIKLFKEKSSLILFLLFFYFFDSDFSAKDFDLENEISSFFKIVYIYNFHDNFFPLFL